MPLPTETEPDPWTAHGNIPNVETYDTHDGTTGYGLTVSTCDDGHVWITMCGAEVKLTVLDAIELTQSLGRALRHCQRARAGKS